MVDPQPVKTGQAFKPPSENLLTSLRSSLRDAFERAPVHPQYVQSLQSFAIADRGSYVPSPVVAATALASGCLEAGALQVVLLTLSCSNGKSALNCGTTMC